MGNDILVIRREKRERFAPYVRIQSRTGKKEEDT